MSWCPNYSLLSCTQASSVENNSILVYLELEFIFLFQSERVDFVFFLNP